jgi:hypothetical protein
LREFHAAWRAPASLDIPRQAERTQDRRRPPRQTARGLQTDGSNSARHARRRSGRPPGRAAEKRRAVVHRRGSSRSGCGPSPASRPVAAHPSCGTRRRSPRRRSDAPGSGRQIGTRPRQHRLGSRSPTSESHNHRATVRPMSAQRPVAGAARQSTRCRQARSRFHTAARRPTGGPPTGSRGGRPVRGDRRSRPSEEPGRRHTGPMRFPRSHPSPPLCRGRRSSCQSGRAQRRPGTRAAPRAAPVSLVAPAHRQHAGNSREDPAWSFYRAGAVAT